MRSFLLNQTLCVSVAQLTRQLYDLFADIAFTTKKFMSCKKVGNRLPASHIISS